MIIIGISGHILGPVKLRRLSRMSGLALNRAYHRNGYAEGVVWTGPNPYQDEHYAINPKTGEVEKIEHPTHWATCSTHQDQQGATCPRSRTAVEPSSAFSWSAP